MTLRDLFRLDLGRQQYRVILYLAEGEATLEELCQALEVSKAQGCKLLPFLPSSISADEALPLGPQARHGLPHRLAVAQGRHPPPPAGSFMRGTRPGTGPKGFWRPCAGEPGLPL
jgi:hypothetical protein